SWHLLSATASVAGLDRVKALALPDHQQLVRLLVMPGVRDHSRYPHLPSHDPSRLLATLRRACPFPEQSSQCLQLAPLQQHHPMRLAVAQRHCSSEQCWQASADVEVMSHGLPGDQGPPTLAMHFAEVYDSSLL